MKKVKLNPSALGLPEVGSREIDRRIAGHVGQRSDLLSAYPAVASLPDEVAKAVEAELISPRIPPSMGFPELREAIALHITESSGTATDATSVAVTAGAMNGLYLLWSTLGDRGGKVIVPTPTYFVEGGLTLSGLTPRWLESVTATAWDWDHIADEIDARTAALFICSPNNPTGVCLAESDLHAIAGIASRWPELAVVVDESYEGLTYASPSHVCAWQLSSNFPNVIVVRSFSKSFAMPWLRIGWVAASPDVIGVMRKVSEWQQLFGASLNQRIALAAMEADRAWLEHGQHVMASNRLYVTDLIEDVERLTVPVPQGGPFIYGSVEAEVTHWEQYERLWEQGLGAVPGTFFGGTLTDFRLPFGGTRVALDRAVFALEQWSQVLPRRNG